MASYEEGYILFGVRIFFGLSAIGMLVFYQFIFFFMRASGIKLTHQHVAFDKLNEQQVELLGHVMGQACGGYAPTATLQAALVMLISQNHFIVVVMLVLLPLSQLPAKIYLMKIGLNGFGRPELHPLTGKPTK